MSPQGRLILTLTSTDLLVDSPITAYLSAIIVSGDDKTKYSFTLGVSNVISVAFPQQSGSLNQFNLKPPTSNPILLKNPPGNEIVCVGL